MCFCSDAEVSDHGAGEESASHPQFTFVFIVTLTTGFTMYGEMFQNVSRQYLLALVSLTSVEIRPMPINVSAYTLTLRIKSRGVLLDDRVDTCPSGNAEPFARLFWFTMYVEIIMTYIYYWVYTMYVEIIVTFMTGFAMYVC